MDINFLKYFWQLFDVLWRQIQEFCFPGILLVLSIPSSCWSGRWVIYEKDLLNLHLKLSPKNNYEHFETDSIQTIKEKAHPHARASIAVTAKPQRCWRNLSRQLVDNLTSLREIGVYYISCATLCLIRHRQFMR